MVWIEVRIRVVASVGLMLAALGLYGVLSYTVSQRTREIGIRMAFGAAGRDVVMLAARQGVVLTGIGILLGLVAGLGLGQLVSSILYDTSGSDPLVFALVSLVMVAVALVACLVPAWRALRVDPLVALRYE